MQRIRVLIADDHVIVRQGLRALLEADGDFTVVGEADTGRQAVRLTQKLNPEVVIMDIAMPGMNGLEATRRIRRRAPSTRVLILSMYQDEEYVLQVVAAGAAGYIGKQMAATDLLDGVRAVSRGQQFRLTTSVMFGDSWAEPASSDHASETLLALTVREAEVLALISNSKTNREIAGVLLISVKTVEKHRQRIMDKLDIHDVAGLTRYALAHRLAST